MIEKYLQLNKIKHVQPENLDKKEYKKAKHEYQRIKATYR